MSFLRRFSSTLIVSQFRRSAFRLHGVYPSVVTPFTCNKSYDYDVDLNRFDTLLKYMKHYPVAGYAFLCRSGEPIALDFKQKLAIISHARKCLGETPVILACAGHESASETIDVVNKMAEIGADSCIVYNPQFFQEILPRKAYLDFYRTVASHSLVPIILYNLPQRHDVTIPVDVIVQLARHPNIAGMLDTRDDISRISQICKHTAMFDRRTHFDVLTSSAGLFLPTLIAGGRGTICALANILPYELHHLMELYEEGHKDRAQKLQWRLMDPNRIVTTKYGIAGLKAVLSKYLDVDVNFARPPVRQLTDHETIECIKAFHQNGFLLSPVECDKQIDVRVLREDDADD